MDLTKGPVAATLLGFSLPFMLSTLLQTLYSTTDTVIVGQYLGSSGLVAVSNGSQLMQMMYMICIGFSTAGQVLIAQSVGAGLQDKARRVTGTLALVVTFLGAVEGLVCILGSGWLLKLLATPAEAVKQARDYVIICGAGMIPTGLYNMFSAVFRGMGDSRHPLLFVAIASGINMVLDILFIGFFGWNVAGAALATVIGQMASVLFSIRFLNRNQEAFQVEFRLGSLRPDRESLRQLADIGIPLAIQSGAVQFSFLFVSHMVNSLGLSVSAAFGAAQKLRNIPGVLTQGLGLGAGSMIGQNLGAGQDDRVKRTVRCTILYCGICNLVFGLVFAFCPVLCFRMFTQEEEVLLYAGTCMAALVFELPGKTLMPGCNALVSAQGFARFSMVIAFLDAFAGRILFCWLLGTVLGMGALGFFVGYSMGTYLTAIPVFIYYVSGLWRRRKRLV